MTQQRIPFKALIAPLDVASVDGRMLSGRGRFASVTPPLFLIWREARSRVAPHAGVVRRITRNREWLMAEGTIFDRNLLRLIRAERVWPEINLINVVAGDRDGVRVLTRGTVCTLVAGQRPAWPTVRFILED